MPLLQDLWPRIRGFFEKLFRRKPPEPGRFVADAKFAWRGFVGVAPWIAPQREYMVYVPMGHERRWQWRRRPLVVLLHGCKQKPEEVAGATRIARFADGEGLLVLLPRQNPHANAWGCWNWFDGPTSHGWGEAAIVAAQIREVRRRYRIDKRRVFVAGLSAGGGLAAIIALRRPGLVAGVFVHSGIACGAASSPRTAIGVLAKGADTDIVSIGREARDNADKAVLPVPLCVVQGAGDNVVSPVHASQLVRQFLALNGHPAGVDAGEALPAPDRTDSAVTPEGRKVTTSEWRIGERLVVRHVLIDALGHAWSGGDGQFGYTDPNGPDATALLGAFIRDATV